MGRTFQIMAWVCVLAIGVLSLVKPSLRPVTIVPHNMEHLAIFAATGIAAGLGYPARPLRNMVLLVIFAGIVELAQLFVPGRHARVIDFVVDALSACVGALLAAAFVKLRARSA